MVSPATASVRLRSKSDDIQPESRQLGKSYGWQLWAVIRAGYGEECQKVNVAGRDSSSVRQMELRDVTI